MSPFASAHTFCASWDRPGSTFLGTVPTNSEVSFARFMILRKKKIVRSIEIRQKEKLRATMNFSEITKFQFEKKITCIILYF